MGNNLMYIAAKDVKGISIKGTYCALLCINCVSVAFWAVLWRFQWEKLHASSFFHKAQ